MHDEIAKQLRMEPGELEEIPKPESYRDDLVAHVDTGPEGFVAHHTVVKDTFDILSKPTYPFAVRWFIKKPSALEPDEPVGEVIEELHPPAEEPAQGDDPVPPVTEEG